MLSAPPLTRPQRQQLLRVLLIGRGLERVLTSLRRRSTAATAGQSEAVMAAIAAAAGTAAGDRLVAPHGFLAAHLATGIGPAQVAAARLRERRGRPDGEGRLLAAVGPQSPVGIAVGAAFALSHTDRHDVAVALIDRRWAEEDGCRSALAMARELALPLVVVAIDSREEAEGGSPVLDRRDFEAIRVAVAAAINGAREDRGPSLLVCAPGPADESGVGSQVARFRARIEDPVTEYERWLMINGFSRSELDGMRAAAGRELDDAVGHLVAGGRGRRVAAAEGSAA
jgi:TPP-dependent pyruvate/acetoin dehydrogenase alpha subunit